MVIFTAKVNKKRILAILAIAAIVAAALLLARPKQEEYLADEVLAKVMRSERYAETNDDRLQYIDSLGYSVQSEPLSQQEVVIPETFDATYEQYNALQKESGFDLEKYAGKTVSQYVYAVTGDESGQDVRLELLVYKNEVIGGSVYTVALDGFMRGLTS